MADRGALTLEGGLTPVLVPRAPPPVPDAGGLPLLALGAVAGVRYALANELEVGVTGFFWAPAPSTANLLDGQGVVIGTVSTTATGFGALLGARYVAGLAWRFHLGVELGLARFSYSATGFTGPGAANAGPATAGKDGLAGAVRAGLEWQWNDHMSVGAEVRLQALLGGAPAAALFLPITFGYSFYLL